MKIVALIAGIANGSADAVNRDLPRFFILSIGVNQYEDPTWPALEFAEADAGRFEQAIGLLPTYQKVSTLLTGKSATKDRVLTELGRLIQESRPADVIAVYFSMHGTLRPNQHGDLENAVIAFDTRFDKLANGALSQAEVRNALNQMRAKRKLLIFATCHSGIGKSVIPDSVRALMSGTKGRIEPLIDVSEGSVVLAAASQGETARESKELRSDIYTHYLLEDLTAADRNADGLTTALEAHDYARDRTYITSKGKQRPTVESSIIGDGDIPLAGKKKNAGRPTLSAYDRQFEDFQIQVNQHAKGVVPMGSALLNGANTISVYAPGAERPFAAFEFNATDGESLSLSDLFADPPLHLELSVGLLYWADEGVQQAFGRSSILQTQLTGWYSAPFMDLGISLGAYGIEAKDQAPGITTALSGIDASLAIGKKWALSTMTSRAPRLLVGIQLSGGIESTEFSVTSHSSSASRGTTANSSRTAISSTLTFGWFLARFGLSNVRLDFNEFGNLAGVRQEFGLGLQMAFGGKIRRQ